ncbi:hypothetical protein E2K80_18840 [Rhodophyticola sp. CCM32]|uniref:hypothetical protein n=1 Tax=Rhodophyticola sp. CCM32 TaxID=2916397 RepID=UPI00107F6369|nr:hypothetical protein [Rhodophyticola sp. CCM32]QBY02540.1 hypothetical protein E2K80_18840 [Rhodophyticola sp. CCM32]
MGFESGVHIFGHRVTLKHPCLTPAAYAVLCYAKVSAGERRWENIPCVAMGYVSSCSIFVLNLSDVDGQLDRDIFPKQFEERSQAMPVPPHDEDITNTRPSLSVDWELYAAMLEESDLSLDQQRALIETLWSIVVMFVDLGFNLDPVAQICGQEAEASPDDPSDLVSLLGDRMMRAETGEEDTWKQ